jgi:uncharacterized DUF497 family protein
MYIICQSGQVAVEWDDRKNWANFKKHGVWFEEAAPIIEHPLSHNFADLDYPGRTVCIGLSDQQQVLLVVYLGKERYEYEEGI